MINGRYQEVVDKYAELKAIYNQLITKKQKLEKLYNTTTYKRIVNNRLLSILKKLEAHSINKLESLISGYATQALNLLFPDENYTLKIDLNDGKIYLIDCKLNKIQPVISNTFFCSGGVIESIAWGLRIGLILLSNKEKCLFLDEPFRYLDRDRFQKAIGLVQEIAHQENWQVIMITHNK